MGRPKCVVSGSRISGMIYARHIPTMSWLSVHQTIISGPRYVDSRRRCYFNTSDPPQPHPYTRSRESSLWQRTWFPILACIPCRPFLDLVISDGSVIKLHSRAQREAFEVVRRPILVRLGWLPLTSTLFTLTAPTPAFMRMWIRTLVGFPEASGLGYPHQLDASVTCIRDPLTLHQSDHYDRQVWDTCVVMLASPLVSPKLKANILSQIRHSYFRFRIVLPISFP